MHAYFRGLSVILNIYVSWSSTELKVRLALWSRFKPSDKNTDHSNAQFQQCYFPMYTARGQSSNEANTFFSSLYLYRNTWINIKKMVFMLTLLALSSNYPKN